MAAVITSHTKYEYCRAAPRLYRPSTDRNRLPAICNSTAKAAPMPEDAPVIHAQPWYGVMIFISELPKGLWMSPLFTRRNACRIGLFDNQRIAAARNLGFHPATGIGRPNIYAQLARQPKARRLHRCIIDVERLNPDGFNFGR